MAAAQRAQKFISHPQHRPQGQSPAKPDSGLYWHRHWNHRRIQPPEGRDSW